MNYDKKLFQDCIQLVINSAGGLYGPVIPVLEKVEDFNIDDTLGQIGEKDDICYVNFTGSNNFHNWVDNFTFFKTKWKYSKARAKVHLGFIEAYSQVRDFLWKRFNSYTEFVITGHSLGGALATLCSFDLVENGKSNVYPVIFASPRVGNGGFKRRFNKHFDFVKRFNWMNDIVPKLPPFFFNFRHVGNQIELADPKTKFEYNMKHPLVAIFGSPKDHSPANYYKGINSLKEEGTNGK